MDSSVLLVEAVYQFKGTNNDELCFKKGSIITLTQKDDDTWWEGTYDGNTGWFPANYVRPYKPSGLGESVNSAMGGQSSALQSTSSEQQMYRALVLRNLLDSERQHITELNTFINNCLVPLLNNKLFNSSDYSTLVRNLERVLSVHQELLSRLEGEGEKASSEQRVGRVFLGMAGDILSQPHRQYCSQHPRAVCFIQEHQSEITRCLEGNSLYEESMEGVQKKPGMLVLTTGLSKPFRRLQQYSGLLQELHRHLPEAHKDRGDAQRAAKIMADFAASCNALRRQKELELEVVTGEISGWERGTLAVLGEVQAMGSVAVLPHNTDRYLVLFPKHLVLLAVSPRMSNFIFQSEHNLTDISCAKLDDCDQYKNAFELTGVKMDRLVAVCQSKTDQQRWVDLLSQHHTTTTQQPPLPSKNSSSSSKTHSQSNIKNSGQISSSKGNPPRSYSQGSGQFVQPPLPPHKVQPKQLPALPTKTAAATAVAPPLPPSHGNSINSRRPSAGIRHSATISHKAWSLCDLRPSAPLRPNLLRKARNIKKDERWHDEDSIILRVVEAYCASTASRYTQASALPAAVTGTLSPFGELRGPHNASKNWCCGLAIKAIRRNVDLD
uniref:Rho guanine nucleotide exchange factor 7-like n=2 Tax=Hirondellea gigas TaxID=1518452 RepID=A0A6A7GA09_9CRUS